MSDVLVFLPLVAALALCVAGYYLLPLVMPYIILPLLDTAAAVINTMTGAKPGDRNHLIGADLLSPMSALLTISGGTDAKDVASDNADATTGVPMTTVLFGIVLRIFFTAKKKIGDKMKKQQDAANGKVI